MLPTADTYERLVDPFEWHIPQQYNIGIDTCDKCADRSGRLALICETHEGQLTPYAFDQLKQLSDGFAHALQCVRRAKAGVIACCVIRRCGRRRSLHFVEDLPLTATGKVVRRELREWRASVNSGKA